MTAASDPTPVQWPDLRHLPPVLDVPTAGRLLGLGRSAAYELVLSGQWPTPVLRLGRRLRIPTVPLLDVLGLTGQIPSRRPDLDAKIPPSPTAPDSDPHERNR